MDWKIKYFKDDILPKFQILTGLYVCVFWGKGGLDKLILKFTWKYKESRIAKTFLKKVWRQGNML